MLHNGHIILRNAYILLCNHAQWLHNILQCILRAVPSCTSHCTFAQCHAMVAKNVIFLQLFALMRNIVQWFCNILWPYSVLCYNAQWLPNVAQHSAMVAHFCNFFNISSEREKILQKMRNHCTVLRTLHNHCAILRNTKYALLIIAQPFGNIAHKRNRLQIFHICASFCAFLQYFAMVVQCGIRQI